MSNVIEAGMIGWTELLPIIAIVVLFFGGKKIPELMKGLGKGVKEFKDGMNGNNEKVVATAKQEDRK